MKMTNLKLLMFALFLTSCVHHVTPDIREEQLAEFVNEFEKNSTRPLHMIYENKFRSIFKTGKTVAATHKQVFKNYPITEREDSIRYDFYSSVGVRIFMTISKDDNKIIRYTAVSKRFKGKKIE
jgi:hypothetical protein